MTAEKTRDATPKSTAPNTPGKRVEVVYPARSGRHRLPPLDNESVNAVFVTHDRFRDVLRAA